MRKRERQAHIWQKKSIGVATLIAVAVVIITIVFVFFPGGLRGPETVARRFFEVLMQTPNNAERLRAAAHIGESDDPEMLIDGLSTRVALEFMRARERQGATQEISFVEGKRPGPRRYVTILSVTENTDSRRTHARRFHISLQKSDNGDWYVTAITVRE